MKKTLPDQVNTFLNFLWVNIPKEWSVNFKYEKYFLYVNVSVENPIDKRPFNVRRKYSSDIILKFQENLCELATESAKEIVSSMRKKFE
jgi:hypothetical protein